MARELEPAPGALATSGGSRLVVAPSWIAGGPAALVANSKGASVGASALGYVSAILIMNSGLPLATRLLMVSAIAGGGLLAALWPRWRRWRTLQVLEETPRVGLPHAQPGERIRLSGVALARSGTFASVIGRQVLVARYVGAAGRFERLRWLRRPYWELHGVDFDLELAGGERIWVRTDQALFLPHPPAPPRQVFPVPVAGYPGAPDRRAWIYGEDALGPGDEVEIAGVLRFIPDPAGSVAHDRQARLVPVLEGQPGLPLLLRLREITPMRSDLERLAAGTDR
jgi:hypothetical protein